MNKYSQISIAVLMTISLSAAPLSAFTPFDESSKIDINNNNKREQLETADIHVEETKSESKSTNKDSKTVRSKIKIRKFILIF